MISRPPRTAAELAPRLRSISETAAADLADDPEERRPRISGPNARRVALAVGLLGAMVATRLGLWVATERIETPSIHAVNAARLRTLARNFEEEARAYRSIAATGRPSPRLPGIGPLPPQAALMTAQWSDSQAIACRRSAHVEECLNLGIPVP